MNFPSSLVSQGKFHSVFAIKPVFLYDIPHETTQLKHCLVKYADHEDNRDSQTLLKILQAITALPDHTKIMAELELLLSHWNANQKWGWDEHQDLIQQLSTLDFTAMQRESFSKRCANTGQWLLESPNFQTWLSSEDSQNSVLWCPGAPGVGKIVITSVVVNHIIEYIGGRRSAVVYIYCEYANAQTFSVENLLGSMVRQLVTQTSDADTVAELLKFVKQTAKNRNLTNEELSSCVEDLSKKFDVVYILVDALDECPEIVRGTLLTRLQNFSEKNMRVFLTSRPDVNVIERIPPAVRAEISATDNDITAFVESKIDKSSILASLTARDPKLKEYIVKRIISQSAGIFLLAGLQTESLGNRKSAREVQSALAKLPTNTSAMYDRTIERIRDQPKGGAELAFKVLSMILGATRPLEVDELRYALGLESGDTKLDYDAIVDVKILLDVTAGLVITYQTNDFMGQREWCRFVHYTLQEYLKANQKELFPSLELDMARVCLSYLSLDGSICGKCDKEDLLDNSRTKFCKHSFFNYAAMNWTHHLRGVQMELMDQSLAYVQDSAKTSIWLEAFESSSCYHMGLSSPEDLPLDPVFLAAHFHLLELFTRLISSRDINTRNSRGETPLIRAVNVQMWQKIGCEPFYAYVSDVKMSQKGEEPSFLRSLDLEQHAMVQLILDYHADIDAMDSLGKTAAFHAVEVENGGILSLLLDRGADIDVRLDGGDSLLHLAAQNDRRVDIMQLLLHRGADVNVLNSYGRSPLHVAANHLNSTILDCLIDYGAFLDVADDYNTTPLLSAVKKGRLETLTALIKRGARLDITDCMGRSPLHLAISPPKPDVVGVVIPAQRVDVVDVKGRTPLHYAYFNSAQVPVGFEIWPSEEWRIAIADVIRQLVQGGASETIADADGRIPKDYSEWSTKEHGYQWITSYWEIMDADDDRRENPHETQMRDANKSEETSENDEESGKNKHEEFEITRSGRYDGTVHMRENLESFPEFLSQEQIHDVIRDPEHKPMTRKFESKFDIDRSGLSFGETKTGGIAQEQYRSVGIAAEGSRELDDIETRDPEFSDTEFSLSGNSEKEVCEEINAKDDQLLSKFSEREVPEDVSAEGNKLIPQYPKNEAKRMNLRAVLSLFGLAERPLEVGKTRVRWQCGCGRNMYDDFTEVRLGAAVELEMWLNESMRNHAAAGSSNGPHSANSSSFPPSRVANSGHRQTAEGDVSLQHLTSTAGTLTRSNENIAVALDVHLDKCWLLVCGKSKRGPDTFLHN